MTVEESLNVSADKTKAAEVLAGVEELHRLAVAGGCPHGNLWRVLWASLKEVNAMHAPDYRRAAEVLAQQQQ